MTATTLLAATLLAPVVLLGPPRLTVAAGAPGTPLTVTAAHLDGVDHIVVTARAIRLHDGRTTERAARVVEVAAPGPNQRAFQFTPARTGVPQVIVVRGAHGPGDDAPFMEVMVRIDGAGAVVGIEYSQRKSLLGGSHFPAVGDDAIRSALKAMGAE
jgi:hypothetical protein